MKLIKTPVKGMNDMLPSDVRLREHVLDIIKKTYASYGFMRIETPVMEHIENLTSKQGGDNEKLIFKVMKRGAELTRALENGSNELADNGLRYDLTVPLSRYYASNKDKLPSPFKALQIGNVWRADNPQKGRFRQFTQCDIDILGDETILAEIELIAATSDALSRIFAEIGITDFTIHINDRQILKAVALQAGFSEDDISHVLIILDKFDKIGLEGIRNELLESGFAEEIIEKYLNIYSIGKSEQSCESFCSNISTEFLSKEAANSIKEIIDCASPMLGKGVKVIFDPTLVRGMGYYTGPIFEVTIDGYGFSIAGGGRYDKMIGRFCGQDVCASGFSIGFERIITILKDHSTIPNTIGANNVAYLIDKNLPIERKQEIFVTAKKLREQGKTVIIQPMRKNLKQQIKMLESEGYTAFEKIYND